MNKHSLAIRALSLSLVLATGAFIGVGAQQYRYTQIYLPQPESTPAQQPAAPVDTPYQQQSVINLPARAIQPVAQVTKSPQEILSELVMASNVPPEVVPKIRVVQSQQLNAATDGQTIIITSALLNQLDSNEERAFVISHELAHVILDHIERTQFRRVGLSLLDALLLRRYVAEGTLLDLAKDLGINLVDKRFARGYEYQADDVGIQLMARAGYDPQAALDVFRTLQAASPGSRLPEFFQSHPMTESRIQALVEKYQLSTYR